MRLFKHGPFFPVSAEGEGGDIWRYSSVHVFSIGFMLEQLQISLVYQTYLNVYCPECPPGGTIGHPGGQQKKLLPFGHGRDLVAFNGTGL